MGLELECLELSPVLTALADLTSGKSPNLSEPR